MRGKKQFKPNNTNKEIINGDIRAKEVRLITETGDNIGVISTSQALQRAEDVNLDLVLISPNANPPVAKIIDYGKHRYQQQKKAKEMRQNQKITQVKEIRLTPTIEEHDLMIKANNARKFLNAGDKVQVSLRFRGRMITHSEFGYEVINKLIAELDDVAKVESRPKMDGRRMIALLVPKK